MCPQWAFDFSRYDTIQYVNETFEYLLHEALPLAPTAERMFHSYTAYDEATREVPPRCRKPSKDNYVILFLAH